MKKILLSFACFFLVFSSSSFAAPSYKEVEDEIFGLQKGWATDMASMFRSGLTSSGFLSEGNMTLSTKVTSPTLSGSVNLHLDKLRVTYDAKNTAVKVEYGGTFGLELKNSTYEYDDTLDDFVKKPNSVNLNVRFAFTLIQVENDIFGQLDTLDVKVEGNDLYKEEAQTMLKEVKKYLGKTYKIPNSSGAKIESLEMNQLLLDGFRLLREKPLFRVTKMNKNGEYALSLRADVAQKLGLDKIASKVNFSYNGNQKKLYIRTKFNPRNNTYVLESKNGEYVLSGVSKKKTRYRNETFKITLKKNFIDFALSDRDGSMQVKWDGKFFDMTQKFASIAEPDHILRLSGKMSNDVNETFLTLEFDGKKIGTFNSNRGGDGSVTYHGDLSITLDMIHIFMNLNGSMKDTIGNYSVLRPSIFEILKD